MSQFLYLKMDHSNTRWCSDSFEIICFYGEKVYLAFALDCHDQECLSNVAYDRPLLGLEIQDLMIKSVDHRFDKTRSPREIQFLSERGSIYRDIVTIQIGRFLGLKSCFTLSYSPEFNGMKEAFVKSIKRDYVYTSDCYDGKTVLRLLPGWFEGYKENTPLPILGTMSSVEYLESINQGV